VRELFTDIDDSGTTNSSDHHAQLSDRERDIVRSLVRGRTAGEMADELYISVNTVKSHLKSVYRKLGVSSRQAAVKRARELGHQL
jgi:LuxR family maltose regulon positive regulatory protein